MKRITCLSLILFSFIHVTFGTVRNVPATYPTIQGALIACVAGDTVLVQPGNHTGPILWPTINGIKLLSAGTAANTNINGSGTGRVMQIGSVLIDTSTVIRGFTITGGNISTGSGYGAGLYISNGSVTLEDVVITGNRVFVPGGHAYGAGLHLTSSSTILKNCVISSNSIDSATWCYGAGVYISGGAPTFTNVIISGNVTRAENWCYGVGLYAQNNANIRLSEVKVTGNTSGDNAIWYYGTGIYMDDVTASLTNVLIASNKSGAGGSFNYGGGLYADGVSNVTMTNVTVTDNSKTGNATINGSGVYARDASVTLINCISYNLNTGMELNAGGTGSVQATYSNIRGSAVGTGNINVIPGFVSASDFHLTPTSLCVGVGTLAGAPGIDLDGNARPLPAATMPDMGCYEVDQSPTSVTEIQAVAFQIYPNPAMAGTIINISNKNGSLKIFDAQGRMIAPIHSGNDNIQFDTGGLAAGCYSVHNGIEKPQKFVVY